MWGRIGNGRLAASPVRAIVFRKPAVVAGPPRSVMKRRVTAIPYSPASPVDGPHDRIVNNLVVGLLSSLRLTALGPCVNGQGLGVL